MQSWVSPPEANGACVAGMATVVETYAPPDASRVPVVCRDEQPVQGLQDTRGPIAAPQHQARRVDDDYARTGTASVFMVVEPLQGWRPVRIRAQRTTVDGALEMEALRRTRDAEARTSARGLRQLQHADDGRVVRGVCRGAGTEAGPAARIAVHAPARQWAQQRGTRTECADASRLTRPPVWRNQATGRGNRRVVNVQSRDAARGRWAIHNQRRTPHTQVPLP